jgi:hypothetical protein
MTEAENLAALDRAATQGGWHLYQHFAAPDFTRADIVGRTRDDDIIENVNGPDAALIVALVNAYRAKQLVLIGPDAVEKARTALGAALADLDPRTPIAKLTRAEELALATAALAALEVK